MTHRIGIDFDNTIVCYHELFFSVARDTGWIRSSVPRSKKEIRDYLYSIEDGKIKWQKLQALVYGPLIKDAPVFEGFEEFLARGSDMNAEFFVVSHKTQYALRDAVGVDLHKASLDWLRENNLLDSGGNSFKRENIFFESTRKGKIKRLASLGCTHFIDDLPEIFKDHGFPLNVEKILFDPLQEQVSFRGVKNYSHWVDISKCILD